MRVLQAMCTRHTLVSTSLKIKLDDDPPSILVCRGRYAEAWRHEYQGWEVTVKVLDIYAVSDLEEIVHVSALRFPLSHWNIDRKWCRGSARNLCCGRCQGRLSSHLQTSAVTDVRTPPHRLLTWHGSRLKGTKGLLEGSGVRVGVW